jgi:hypothetical protein
VARCVWQFCASILIAGVLVSCGAGEGSTTDAPLTNVIFQENFESFRVGTGWTEGSVHGNWRDVSNGGGTTGIVLQQGSRVLHENTSVPYSVITSHSSLTVSTPSFNDLDLSLQLRTVAQLRSSSPNPWEVAWVLWHYGDANHYYYVILKPNGWEIGKRDPAYPGYQRFLATGATPSFTVGNWYNVRIRQVGGAISVWANGALLTSFTDSERPYLSGSIGLSGQDAHVHFDNVIVSSTTSSGSDGGTGSGSGTDAGTGTGSGTDAGTGSGSGTDAGTGTGSGTDAGTGTGSGTDAGTGTGSGSGSDGGTSSGTPDAGTVTPDAGTTTPDAGTGGGTCDPNATTWRTLRIGAGGWITGIDISADGTTKVVRTDTYGGYVLDPTGWTQVVTSTSMPADNVGMEMNEGIYEIRVAPSAPSRLYMVYRGYVYRSDNRGASWSRTAFARVNLAPNDDARMVGEKAAVDPANPDVFYVGTQSNGLFVTFDGGATWSAVSGVPAPSSGNAGVNGIVFDVGSGTSGGKTNVIYATSSGNGVYRSTDAGATWALVSGGPASVNHATIGPDRTYYAAVPGSGSGSVWRLSGSTWATITPASNIYWHTVLADPNDAQHIVAGSDGGYLVESHDRGATWSNIYWTVTRTANDIPWLAWTDEQYMSNGAMRFDPTQAGKIWFAEGIGVWTTQVTAGMTSVNWTSVSLGIEQLVANSISAPPGGNPVLASWDRALFTVTNPDVYPSQHWPFKFEMGWDVEYASTDPSFMVAVIGWVDVQSAYSTDRGATWTRFPSMPLNSNSSFDTFGFGVIAASTPDNFVWVPSNKRAPFYTTNRGQSWQQISLPGVADTADGWTGLHMAYYLDRHIVAADRVTAGTFYMYHTPAGLFRSTDSGASWTNVYSGEVAPWSGFNAKMRSVPGKAGHLFFTSGPQSGATPSGAFMHSTNGGATWTAIPDVLEVFSFGFGKEATGASYPTLYIAGYVRGEWGYWRSTDEGASWTKIGSYPLGSLDEPKTIDGDKDVFGKVYVGFNGSGYAYGAIGCP